MFSRLSWLSVPLLAALSISGCGGGGRSSSAYGGPYYVGGDTEAIFKPKADEKAAQFQEMNKKRWDSSKAVELSRGSKLFVTSLRWNRDNSNAPEARRFQQYNYAVQGRKIFVAVWDPRGKRGICNSGSPPFPHMKVKKDLMVNEYPETSTAIPRDTKKCILADGKHAVLDDSSKHFMLAHGPGTRITSYNPRTWATTTVDYAGEIVVAVDSKKCYYTINQNSGTYSPKAGIPSDRFKYLDAVAKLFAGAVGAYPAYEWDKKSDLEKPTDGKRTTAINCG
jgi:hypothetical protein